MASKKRKTKGNKKYPRVATHAASQSSNRQINGLVVPSTKLSLFDADLVKIFLLYKLTIIAAILLIFYYFDQFHQTNLWNRWYTGGILQAWYIPFSNWDGQHYLLLADQGYGLTGGPTVAASKAFFPMLPLSIRLFNVVIGDIYSATMALNFIASYFFIHFFYGYALHYLPRR